MDADFLKIKEKIARLSLGPGVYLMKNAAGEIIYVGKAKNLKNRVSQYFQSGPIHPKVAAMVANIADFDCIVTDGEFEALVLECNLIKLHKPRYNILLKDDKQYPFIRITMGEEYPKISLARKRGDDKSLYFGPYPSSGAVKEIIYQIQNIFKIATCKKKFPQQIKKERPCLNYHIGRCIAPCQGVMSQEEYKRVFKKIAEFLEGDYTSLAEGLRRQMESYAEGMEFEKAARCRDQLRQIEQMSQKQKVYLADGADRDVVAEAAEGGFTCFSILKVRSGKLIHKESHIFDAALIGDEERALEQFIAALYGPGNDIPPQIVTEGKIEDPESLARFLTGLAERKVEVRLPKRGELVALLAMARQNAKEEIAHTATEAQKKAALLKEAAGVLGISRELARIEAFDIANTGKDAMVGTMVVYKDGVKSKEDYRRFSIRSISSPDDYAATKEVIYRRMEKAGEEDPRFLPLPDVILLDGGRGHVSAVSAMFLELGIDIPLFGMVKDNRHHFRALVGPGGELPLRVGSPVFALFGQISDEVHRFTIAYHKGARGKASRRSVLEEIPGVGAARRRALLAHFGSVKRIAQAGEEELCKVRGVSPELAAAIRGYFEEEQERKNR